MSKLNFLNLMQIKNSLQVNLRKFTKMVLDFLKSANICSKIERFRSFLWLQVEKNLRIKKVKAIWLAFTLKIRTLQSELHEGME